MRFENKVVLITGASRGIGKATALEFAKEGAKIGLDYIGSEKEAENAINEIKKFGVEAVAIKCDVSDEKQVNLMVDKIIKKFGRIDVLVNNAGIVFDVPFNERTIDQWKKTLEVNLIGTFICARAVAKFMKKQKSGSIVNISSTNGENTYHPDSIDYSASKAGVINLTKSLAMELGPDIRVNSIAPGWVDTEMNKELPEDYLKRNFKEFISREWLSQKKLQKQFFF